MAGNVWAQSDNPLHDAMLRTYQEAFDDLYVIDAGESTNEIFLALPRKEAVDQADLARRASQLSRDEKLRFDVGDYVTEAFRHADKKDPVMRVLLDKDKEKGKDKGKEQDKEKGKEKTSYRTLMQDLRSCSLICPA